MASNNFLHCPCCGFRTLLERAHYEICPVCYWEDDPIQEDNVLYDGGANDISLQAARRNFLRLGAMSQEFVGLTRPPTSDEVGND